MSALVEPRLDADGSERRAIRELVDFSGEVGGVAAADVLSRHPTN
jgi:hypothetical protein